ncbi:putative methyltransferase-domain-containing protein [Polychytrium aggregatum]|uniref:putative methyltransferase-domain-containing protein n=1 Tax=Polychytrium aggregatum TaxID=110093 RepID=UPI0022FE2BA5|nr:putative methyltransferase-domain-containing protein [Polychytrium aggregatum]KAI9206537.1 putative methyltransferase-domain-containing protein [Polychytrium aggregatum]
MAQHITRLEFLAPQPRGRPTDRLVVQVSQLLESAYGSYVWPSALVLAAYIQAHSQQFEHARVIELGCGTGMAGIAAALCGASHVVLTDLPDPPVLKNVAKNRSLNGLDETAVRIVPLQWGTYSFLEHHWADMVDADFILGADLFYDSSDFDDLLATVAYLMGEAQTRAGRRCVFLTTYQERSSRRCIQSQLERYGLVGQVVPLESFGFDPDHIRTAVVERNGRAGDEEADEEAADEDDEEDDEEDEERNGRLPDSVDSVILLRIQQRGERI